MANKINLLAFDQALFIHFYKLIQKSNIFLWYYKLNINKNMRTVNQQGINSDDFQLFKTFTQKFYGGHKRSPTSIAWNKSGDKFATAQNYVKLWDFDAYGVQKIQQIKSHENTVQQIKFFSNVMLGSLSKQLFKIWDVRQSNLKSVKSQKKVKSDFVSFAFTNQSSQQQASSAEPNLQYTLLTKDNTLSVYDIRNTSSPIHSINVKAVLSNLNNSIQLTKVIYDKSNSILFAVGGENSTGQILMFNAADNYGLIPEGIIDCHCSKINDIAVDPTNSYIATVSEDSLTQIHQLPEMICQKVYSNKFDANIKMADFSHDGKYVAVASEGQTIDIFNVKYGGWAYRITLYNECKALAWNPKKLVLCYISSYEQKKKSIQKGQQTYINIFSANITI